MKPFIFLGSLPSTPTVEEHLTLGDPQTSGSRVGDSGYMSFPGGISAPTGIPEYTANGQLVEAHLMPHFLQGLFYFYIFKLNTKNIY